MLYDEKLYDKELDRQFNITDTLGEYVESYYSMNENESLEDFIMRWGNCLQ